MEPITDNYNRKLRDLRVSVTDRCNYRCPYCMPLEVYGEKYEFLKRNEVLSFEEIERLVRLFVKLGVKKVRITGGEPLVRKDLESLISRINSIDSDLDIALTTNGYLLAEKVQKLKDAGLSRLTVSLDSLDEITYKKMNGKGFGPDKVLNGIKRAEQIGFSPIKINVVVQKGYNDKNFLDVANHFRSSKNIVRFIEFMDVGNKNGWALNKVVPAKEILEVIDKKFPLESVSPTYEGEVAKKYRYKDGAGEIGIISSVSQPFCGDCTRARLSTDGKLITCLFATQGVDLKTPIRSGSDDDELISIIRSTWGQRTDRYSELRSQNTDLDQLNKPKVEMYYIGG
ncbi:MAG: GTP 3',8-cyclase MoaA [Dehalococcoidia bacterium]|nr:GTP 3',8-cyclase MoaA [Dehalococcoidia bacterium]